MGARRAASEIKEQFGYVAQDYGTELHAAGQRPDMERSYTLPDGNTIISAGSERFRCAEALFQPGLVGRDFQGVHDMAWEAIIKSGVDNQRVLSSSIVLSGGTMCFGGMQERMQKELSELAPATMPIKVTLPREPKHAAFTGGSILASLGDAHRNWISREEYEEFGVSAIHAKSMCLTDMG